MEKAKHEGNTDSKNAATNFVNEIDDYLDCRYVSVCEAAWRLFAFHIHHSRPSVLKLTLHLPDQQRVVFEQAYDLSSFLLSREGIERTMFTTWMEKNRECEDARKLTYIEFSSMFVWHSTEKIWTPRKKQGSIGRVVYIHPTTGELYYLRILVNVVRGPTSFKDLYTVSAVTHNRFKEACYARGLLDDNKDWHDCLLEAALWATSNQLRKLFVTLLSISVTRVITRSHSLNVILCDGNCRITTVGSI